MYMVNSLGFSGRVVLWFYDVDVVVCCEVQIKIVSYNRYKNDLDVVIFVEMIYGISLGNLRYVVVKVSESDVCCL